jgi:hypothetical protein
MLQDFISFPEILTVISNELRLPIVAEGAPMNYEGVTAEKVSQIMAKLRGRPRLLAVADLLDFSTEVVRGVVFLSKKYSSALDVPCISYDELFNFYKMVLAVSKEFSPPYWVQGEIPPDMRWKQDFIRLLGPDQWDKACSKGLMVSELSQEQSGKLKKILSGSYIGGHYPHLANLADTLEAIRQSSFALSGSGLSLRWQTKFGVKASEDLSKLVTPDAKKPCSFKSEMTLGDLEKKTLGPRRNQPEYHIDDYLLEKPIIHTFNIEASPELIGFAVSQLYNLKLERKMNGYQIRSKSFPRSIDVTDFQKLWVDTMPSPLRRSILQPTPVSIPVSGSPSGRAEFKRQYRNNEVSQGALQFLITNVSEKIRHQKGAPLPFEKASPREKTALALWFSAQYIAWISGHLYVQPLYMTHFNDLRILCQQYVGRKGKPMFNMSLSCWNPAQNKWQFTIGWGDVWDISRS